MISRRRQVAQVRGFPVYVITDVSLIPLSSQDEAKKAILQKKESLKNAPGGTDGAASDSDVSDGGEEGSTEHDDDYQDQDSPVRTEPPSTDDPASQKRPAGPNRSTSNVAEDVIGKKGQYGRFAERWFSKKGWTSERRRTLGMSTDDTHQLPSTTEQVTTEATRQSDLTSAPNTREVGTQKSDIPTSEAAMAPSNDANPLLPKLLRTTRILLTSNSFFYSYDMDITRRLGTVPAKVSDLPLHKSVDPLVSHASNCAYLISRAKFSVEVLLEQSPRSPLH